MSRTKRRSPSPDSWTSIKRTLRRWDERQLLGLIGDLFKTVLEAKAAIVGRVLQDQPLEARAAALNELRGKIHQALHPEKANVPAARRIADQYFRSTGDADGALSLYVETILRAMDIACRFGWDDGAFYDTIVTAVEAALQCLDTATDPEAIDMLAARVEKQLKHPNFPGYGMDETLHYLAEALQARANEKREELKAALTAQSAGDW